MDFASLRFLGFLTAAAVLCRVCPARYRAIVITAASYAFYFSCSGAMALLLLVATAAAFLVARAIQLAPAESVKRGLSVALVCALIGMLVLFKSAWLSNSLLSRQVLMPLGVSYYTFKLISYVVDVYRGKICAEKSFVSFAAYAAFFPQIVAGPIERSEPFLTQAHKAEPARFEDALLGVQRILLGYFKKFIVADNLAILVNYVYAHAHAPGTPVALGVYAFPLQLHADFSGLSDIAVGAGLLLGFETAENFNAPFSACSPSEFWRRWHMTLTNWLSDYVFMPLRMWTRALGDVGLVLSFLVNMVLIGLWHGFRWGFAVFGVVHAVYLSVDALTARARKRYYKRHGSVERAAAWIGPAVVFNLVALSLVCFRGETVADAFYVIGHLGQGVGLSSPQFRELTDVSGRAILAGFAGYVAAELGDFLRRRNQRGELVARMPRWARWSIYACTASSVAFVVLCLLASGLNHNPFIYSIF